MEPKYKSFISFVNLILDHFPKLGLYSYKITNNLSHTIDFSLWHLYLDNIISEITLMSIKVTNKVKLNDLYTEEDLYGYIKDFFAVFIPAYLDVVKVYSIDKDKHNWLLTSLKDHNIKKAVRDACFWWLDIHGTKCL